MYEMMVFRLWIPGSHGMWTLGESRPPRQAHSCPAHCQAGLQAAAQGPGPKSLEVSQVRGTAVPAWGAGAHDSFQNRVPHGRGYWQHWQHWQHWQGGIPLSLPLDNSHRQQYPRFIRTRSTSCPLQPEGNGLQTCRAWLTQHCLGSRAKLAPD